jgi:D-alanine-D-alanine ligase-like ATP-grasp enzyme
VFGLDFGEIDLIRNNSDGRLYILDVNNMAGNAMFKHMPKDLINKIMQAYTDHFQSKFIL